LGDGKIANIQYFSDKFMNADLNKDPAENGRNAPFIAALNGQIIICAQVAGLIAWPYSLLRKS
jgi:phosphatidylserine decarboxylase